MSSTNTNLDYAGEFDPTNDGRQPVQQNASSLVNHGNKIGSCIIEQNPFIQSDPRNLHNGDTGSRPLIGSPLNNNNVVIPQPDTGLNNVKGVTIAKVLGKISNTIVVLSSNGDEFAVPVNSIPTMNQYDMSDFISRGMLGDKLVDVGGELEWSAVWLILKPIIHSRSLAAIQTCVGILV